MTFPGRVVRRSSVVMFVLYGVLGTTPASAQTVVLRHIAPGSTLELVVDGNPAVTAKADAGGNATATAAKSGDSRSQTDANIWLETCDDLYRVILAAPRAPIATSGCRGTQIGGLYLVQSKTSIVIDANSSSSLLIRQGPAYSAWLTDPRPVAGASATSAAREEQPPLTGPVAFGGVGLGTALHFDEQSCGNVTCSWDTPLQFGGGIGWWVNDFFGAEGRYGYLGKLTATADQSDLKFSTTREAGFLSLAGRAGFRKGRFRPFGYGGMSFDRATVTTTQTTGEGTQTLAMRARGWAPVFGAGVEVWLSPRFGIYADGQRLGLKGKDEHDSPLELDDTQLTVLAGLTVRLPRR